MTPETRADIRAKANDKLAAEVEVNRLGGWLAPAPVDSEIDLARRDWAAKSNALTAVLSTPTIIHLLDASEPVAGGDAGPMAVYDAGLFSISGGGNVDWWLGYLRAELGWAHEFYDDQYEQLRATYARLQAERDAAVAEAGRLRAEVSAEPDWLPIADAPRGGRRVLLKGTRGPYGVTYWEAIGRWIQTPRNPTSRHDYDWHTDNDASLKLAGYEPTHWAALAGSAP